MNIYTVRLVALREVLKRQSLDGFLVPMADEYQCEITPSSARRIAYLSGFMGSAGLIIVLGDRAVFFTDSRYTLQAEEQLPQGLFSLHDSAVMAPVAWLKDNLCAGMKLGFDPWLHRAKTIEIWKKTLEEVGVVLTPTEYNPVDAIWPDRPSPPAAPVRAYAMRYAGCDSNIKRRDIADDMIRQKLDAAVLTDPASIAWLLNVRGGDVPHTPLPLSFAILHADAKVDWFIDPRKSTDGLDSHFGSGVTRHDPSAFLKALQGLGAAQKRVRVDSSETSYKIIETLRESGVVLSEGDDPCALPKACKNATELSGMKAAHIRDGVALVNFLAWLDAQLPAARITERSAEEKLNSCRASQDHARGPSFDTIAGVGPHGAIVHYRATEKTDAVLESNTFFLLDSGGQYLDGTTDVTRTIVLGTPSAEMRNRFTRVLKGHIALASIRFPVGTTGAELEILARQFLWAEGLDYGHGTGHGVGSYLGVHEGPQGISRRNHTPLKVGMVVSNEPGFYKAGHYGIRLENLQAVVEIPGTDAGAPVFLGFEPLTLVPFDRRGLDPTLLTVSERAWLNAYHARVRAELTPRLDASTAAWLENATSPM